MYKRLKEARIALNLSQEFVAKQLGLSRTSLVAIEANQRKVSAEEVKRFSELYGIGVETLMYGVSAENENVAMFARKFSDLSDVDQQEIMNLIDFKRRYKEYAHA